MAYLGNDADDIDADNVSEASERGRHSRGSSTSRRSRASVGQYDYLTSDEEYVDASENPEQINNIGNNDRDANAEAGADQNGGKEKSSSKRKIRLARQPMLEKPCDNCGIQVGPEQIEYDKEKRGLNYLKKTAEGKKMLGVTRYFDGVDRHLREMTEQINRHIDPDIRIQNAFRTPTIHETARILKRNTPKVDTMGAADVESLVEDLVQKKLASDREKSGAKNSYYIQFPTKFAIHPSFGPGKKQSDLVRLEFVKGIFLNPPIFKGTERGLFETDIYLVLEWLTDRQEQCMLSQKEFLDKLVCCFKGPALTYVMQLRRRNNIGVDDIYRKLEHRYSRNESPADADRFLSNIKKYKFTSLQQCEQIIERLSHRASLAFLPGEARRTYEQLVSVKALKAMLPDTVEAALATPLDRIRADGREPTFDEFSDELFVHEDAMDRYLYGKGGQELPPSIKGEKSAEVKPHKFSKVSKGKGKKKSEQVYRSNSQSKGTWNPPPQADSKKSLKKEKKRMIQEIKRIDDEMNKKGQEKKQAQSAQMPNLKVPPPPIVTNQNQYNSSISGHGGGPQPFAQLGSKPCSLCPSSEHLSRDCFLFPPGYRTPAGRECRKCSWNRKHREDLCPVALGKAYPLTKTILKGN